MSIACINEYSYFCKVAEDEEEANEIFSDNQSRIDMMDRIIRRKMLPIVAIFLCCVIPQAVRMADGMYTDRMSIAFYIIISLIFHKIIRKHVYSLHK